MTALFSTPKAAAAPTVKPTAAMPDTEDPSVLAARRRASAEAASRSGRASTILSTDRDTLGAGSTLAGDYASSTLGGR